MWCVLIFKSEKKIVKFLKFYFKSGDSTIPLDCCLIILSNRQICHWHLPTVYFHCFFLADMILFSVSTDAGGSCTCWKRDRIFFNHCPLRINEFSDKIKKIKLNDRHKLNCVVHGRRWGRRRGGGEVKRFVFYCKCKTYRYRNNIPP